MTSNGSSLFVGFYIHRILKDWLIEHSAKQKDLQKASELLDHLIVFDQHGKDCSYMKH